MIRQSFQAWLEPLRRLSPLIVSAEDFLFPDEGEKGCEAQPTADVTYEYTFGRGQPRLFRGKIALFDMGSREDLSGIVLHETGHTFGLADTYEPVVLRERAACKLGHPYSVMCNIAVHGGGFGYPTSLFPDDIDGIRASFCRTHGARHAAACAAVPPAGAKDNLDDGGAPVFSLSGLEGRTERHTVERAAVDCLRITRVEPASPAARAGLSTDHCLVRVNRRPVARLAEVLAVLRRSFVSIAMVKAISVPEPGRGLIDLTLHTLTPAQLADIQPGQLVTPRASAADTLYRSARFVGREGDALRVLIVERDRLRVRGLGAADEPPHDALIDGWVSRDDVTRLLRSRTGPGQ